MEGHAYECWNGRQGICRPDCSCWCHHTDTLEYRFPDGRHVVLGPVRWIKGNQRRLLIVRKDNQPITVQSLTPGEAVVMYRTTVDLINREQT